MTLTCRTTLAAACLLALAARAAPPLRVLYSAAVAPPLVEMNDPKRPNQLSGGFTMRFGELLAAELGTVVSFEESARKRIEPMLLDGQADLVCNANPAWFGTAAALQWSAPVYSRIETVVSRADDSWAPQSLADLAGHRLGTVLGYRYPELEPLFASGRVIRRDEVRLAGNFRLLDLNRIDALVSTRDEIAAHLEQHPARARYRVSPMVISQVNAYCAVPLRGNWGVDAIDTALARLQQNGRLTVLLERYNLSPPQ